MKPTIVSVKEDDGRSGKYHIMMESSIQDHGALTVCGWVDVAYEVVKGKHATCKSCISIVKFCKSLELRG